MLRKRSRPYRYPAACNLHPSHISTFQLDQQQLQIYAVTSLRERGEDNIVQAAWSTCCIQNELTTFEVIVTFCTT
jgi:hypothetical protein